MRKAFSKIHLWLSIPFGILISVVCLSGAALVFEEDITRALNPGFYRVEVEDGTKPLTPSELVAKLPHATPGLITDFQPANVGRPGRSLDGQL